MKEIYKTYDIEDLLEDQDVIAFIEDKLNESEIASWKTWLDDNQVLALKIKEAREINTALRSDVNILHTVNTNQLWSKIEEETSSEAKVVPMKRPFDYKRWLSIAAVFVILGSYIAFQYLSPVAVETISSEQLVSILPNGSKVEINSGSKFEYKKRGWKDERNVYLEGEAFFNVSKGVPFNISTPEGKVEVLGTKFNVYARNGVLDVEVLSGTVRVTSISNEQEFEVILEKGDQIYLENGALVEDKLKSRMSWLDNILSYENININVILNDIERDFNVKIDRSEIGEIGFFTGVVPVDEINLALQAVLWPLNLSFEKNENGYRIFSEGE